MANFLFIRDDDPVRRQFAALRARERVAFLPRLRAELALTPHYAVTWAAAAGAPVEQHCAPEPDDGDCLLFGEPLDEKGRPVSAADLARRHDLRWNAPNELNGYYAAVLAHPHRGVRVEADVLGVFPIYYWQGADVLLVGSSPELFRCHPSFRSRLDLHGVAALLLTSGIVGGRTLWRGVRRLAPDHRLLAAPGADAIERPPDPPAIEPAIATLDEAVREASTLHLEFLRAGLQNSTAPGLLLSGGLDSRHLAGFLTTLGHRPQCLTFGQSGDLDVACATQVARALDLPQTLCEVDPQDYATHADSSIRWEQLSGGLYALPLGWNLCVHPPPVTVDRIVCGLTLDAVIGGPKEVAPARGPLSFEQLRIARLGFARRSLDPLIGSPELAGACDDVRHELVQSYLAAGPADHLREWRMNLAHRHRFAVGACAWRYSLFAWPVMPALDRRLLRLAARLPCALTAGRRVQTRMLVTRYPALARLELDRNYLDTMPLIGAPRSLWFDVRRRATKLQRRCRAWFGRDPRFYVRTMGFDSPGWRVVRALADGARPAAGQLFRPELFTRLAPDARVKLPRGADPIAHSAPLKNTVGLLLWLRQQG